MWIGRSPACGRKRIRKSTGVSQMIEVRLVSLGDGISMLKIASKNLERGDKPRIDPFGAKPHASAKFRIGFFEFSYCIIENNKKSLFVGNIYAVMAMPVF